MDNRYKPPKLFGTPLSTLLEDARDDRESAGPVNRRRQRIERNQIVQDDQGRRRFHGAFTGGFSAGYHNTVDSVQGFHPKSFTFRRGARAQDHGSSFQHRPEDYMDEEDLSEFGIAPKKVRLAGQFSDVTLSDEPRSKLGIPLVVNDSIGEKILRHMTLNRTASCTKQDVYRNFTAKNDYHGLGYEPLTPRPSVVGLGTSQSPLEASLKSGTRLKISGEAFGVGVLDDDEDNLYNLNEYGHDDLANYDFGCHKLSRTKVDKKSVSSNFGSRRPKFDDPHLLPGFELTENLTAMELCDNECSKYPLPVIEQCWKMPVRTEPIIKPRKESDLNRKNIDSYTSRIVSFHDKFTRSESSQAKKASDIEVRSGLMLYSDLKTFVEPVVHEQKQREPDSDSTKITISRRVVDWYPCSLLCKHFGVENPYPDNKYCGVMPSDLGHQSEQTSDLPRAVSKRSNDGEELAPLELRKSIFNVYFRNTDDGSDSDRGSENEPQVIELDSNDKFDSTLLDEAENQATYERNIEEPRDLRADPEVVVMDVPKKEPELIVLSSSDSSKSGRSSPASSSDEDAYGPPLPPSKQTLKGLHSYPKQGQAAEPSSTKSHKRKSHKMQSHTSQRTRRKKKKHKSKE